jgi:hypothetical protein
LAAVLDHIDPAELGDELAKIFQKAHLPPRNHQHCPLVSKTVVRHAIPLPGGAGDTSFSTTLGGII